jgi:hypothetical protein
MVMDVRLLLKQRPQPHVHAGPEAGGQSAWALADSGWRHYQFGIDLFIGGVVAATGQRATPSGGN